MDVCLFYKNMRLVPYSSEYDEQTVAWLNDPATSNSFGLSRNINLESHRSWLASQENFLMWAILDVQNLHHGNISIKINPNHASAYLQIYIGDIKSRGKGLGWNSLVCILNYAFDCLKLHRIWLHTNPKNIPAIRLYSKAGFVMEGIERESILYRGKFLDQMRWSLLANEWEFRRKEVLT